MRTARLLVALLAACGGPPDLVSSNGVSYWLNGASWPLAEVESMEAKTLDICSRFLRRSKDDLRYATQVVEVTVSHELVDCGGGKAQGCQFKRWIDVIDTQPCVVRTPISHELTHFLLGAFGRDDDHEDEQKRVEQGLPRYREPLNSILLEVESSACPSWGHQL